MPEIRPARREAFAALLAQDYSPAVAWVRLNGVSDDYVDKAKRLADQPEVVTRVVELRSQQLRHRVTVDSLTFEYEEAREMARRVEQPGAMVQATSGKAKLHGFDRSEQINIDNRTVNVMGDVELARRMTTLLTRGANAVDALPEWSPDQDVV